MIPSSALRILLCAAPVDMRRSFDGLAELVVEQLDADPTAENVLYVFVNARRTRAKVLWRDSSGFCLLYKRLDARVFALPELDEGVTKVSLDARSLSTLLDGVTADRAPLSTNRDLARAAKELVKRRLMASVDPQLSR